MENNMNLEDFFNNLFPSEEEKAEVSQYQFDSESQIDEAIEQVKILDADEVRYKALYEEKLAKLKFDLEVKKCQIEKKREWILFNLKNSVKAAKDAKDTKTTIKKSYFAGEVIIKKSATKLLKPELTEEEILKDFKEYKKEKTEVTLDWAELKKGLKIIDGKVIMAATGVDMSTLISTEVTAESVSVK
jgi:hypothetical protein